MPENHFKLRKYLYFAIQATFLFQLLIGMQLLYFFVYIWTVKIIYFIFALYMFSLAVYPCYEDDCVDEFNIAINVDQDDHKDEDSSPCTPFCVSACCAIHVHCVPQFNAPPVLQKTTAQHSTYTIKFAPLVVVSIWQPPKRV